MNGDILIKFFPSDYTSNKGFNLEILHTKCRFNSEKEWQLPKKDNR